MRQWNPVLVAATALLIAPQFGAVAQEVPGSTNSSNGFSNSSSRSRSNRSSSSFDSQNDQFTDFGGSSRTGRGSTSRQNRDKNNQTKAKSTGTPGPGSKATPGTGKEMTTAKGKKAPSSGGGGKAGGGEARAATNIEFKMKANPNTNLLYIEGIGTEPTMNILANEGEDFVTRISYVNPRGSNYKTFSVAIKYDPGILEPTGIDDSDIASQLESPSSAHVDEKRGIITFKAVLHDPKNDPTMTVFKIQWKALTPTSNSTISFINDSRFRSNVLDEEDHNALIQRDEDGEVETSEKAGLVDAAVSVVPSAKTARAISDDEGSFSAIAMANNITAGTAEGGVALELKPRRANVKVGEDFLVDIIISNPKHAELDTVKLKLRFDPAVLQVVDYDDNNWITQGVNIYDGDYHDDLPFDYHRKNTADNDRGVIQYDMGFAARVRVPTQGVIATIRFRAVAAAADTQLSFVYDDAPDAEPQTAVSFLGFNLVGSPGQRSAALRNVDVTVSNL